MSLLSKSLNQKLNYLPSYKNSIYSVSFKETPVFPPGIAALRRRNLGEKLVAGSIPLKGHF